MKKLKEILFLSDKGYTDLKKAIIACTITNLAMLLPFCITVMVFSELLNPFLGQELDWQNIWLLWGAGIISAIIVFLASKNDYRKTYIASYKESNVTRLRIAEHLRKLPMSFFNTKDLSELTTNMMSDCSSMESMLSSTIPPLIANGISVTLTCVLLALFDWRLALCVFITLPIAFLVIWCSRKYQIKLFEKQVETKLNASSQVQEYLEGIKIIKSCNLSGVHFRTLNRALLEMKKIAVKVEMVVGIFMSSASMILQAGMSNVKRKDSKNRNLRNGESQRKDGRYVYKYTDIYGKPQFIYSWKLVPTDKTPAGKRDDISLREKEAQIKKDLNDGIDTVGGKMTVCQLYDKKNSQRKNIKRATEKGRQYLMNALKNDPLGMRAIDTVKQSDAKEWAIRMSEKGYAYKTIDNYKRSLKASFYMAIQDDCIRKNPFEFKLSDVLEDDTEQKVILTPEQEERLLAFMEKDKIYSKYYDEVVLLLETGLRISEFCGLTTHIDMQNRILNIDHQLLKDSEMGYYIETPKTKNGKRELPLTERAYQAIQRILKNRGKAQPLIVGGYSNFLFLNREGLPKVAGNYEGMVRGLIKKYNKYHTDKLPNITPHSFRHTYCTNMANRGMNPNTLQYLMGHANITMTLGYYAHGTFQSAKAELERLAC